MLVVYHCVCVFTNQFLSIWLPTGGPPDAMYGSIAKRIGNIMSVNDLVSSSSSMHLLYETAATAAAGINTLSH